VKKRRETAPWAERSAEITGDEIDLPLAQPVSWCRFGLLTLRGSKSGNYRIGDFIATLGPKCWWHSMPAAWPDEVLHA
jgi:hypothetical protein